MICFDEVKIEVIDDYFNLNEVISNELIDEDVIRRLQDYIGLKCKKVLVEYPYFDKDYLSTYYAHYAQKFRSYSKWCCRLHILGEEDEYYGNVVLRPTIEGTRIGGTYLVPEILIREKAYLITTDINFHVLGNDMKCNCFPWMMQETDIDVCAHVALWTILRYYGTKYTNYSDTTMGEIIAEIEEDWGRKTPSNGLTPIQISNLLKKHSFTPIVRKNNKDIQGLFLNEVIAYIESGIPIIGILSPKQHAVSIVGHGEINYEILGDDIARQRIAEKGTEVVLHSKLINSLYVMEDNFFPYRVVGKDLPTSESDVDYFLQEIVYAVIPLYSRMQLVYNEVYYRYLALVKAKVMNWNEKHVARIYITSSNSLKREAFQSVNMNGILKDIILGMNLPKFVWCIDIASDELYKDNKTEGRIIIDTTCGTYETDIWILMHDSKEIRYYDMVENRRKETAAIIEPYDCYVNNLKMKEPIYNQEG